MIGCIILTTLFFKQLQRHFTPSIIKDAVILAIINIIYNLMMFYALQHLGVATSIFVLSMPTVFIPIILFFCKKPFKKQVWIGVSFVFIGIINSLDLNFPKEQTVGLLFAVLFSIARSVYIIKLNDLAKKNDPFVILTWILGAVACFSFIAWFIIDPRTFWGIEYSPQTISSIFIIGYFIVAFANLINIFAQKSTSPVSASLIYSLYCVFSITLAVVLPPILINPITITPEIVFNCFLIASGSFVAEIDLTTIKTYLQK